MDKIKLFIILAVFLLIATEALRLYSYFHPTINPEITKINLKLAKIDSLNRILFKNDSLNKIQIDSFKVARQKIEIKYNNDKNKYNNDKKKYLDTRSDVFLPDL